MTDLNEKKGLAEERGIDTAEETAEAAEVAAEEAAEATAESTETAAEEATEKKTGKGRRVLLFLLTAMLLFSTGVSALYLYDRVTGRVGMDGGVAAANQGPTRENDIVIADEYTIEDTSRISDAYKEGKMTDNGLEGKDQELLEMAAAVLEGSKDEDGKVIEEGIIKEGMTDLEKETAVYEWMVENIKFDEEMTTLINNSRDSGSPYGSLKNRKAVCVGYATTFRLFMQMLDIECMVVHNDEFYHAWDLVKIDGHWYHVDVYSDVSNGKYGNFNLNDEIMMMNQTWDTAFFPPADSMDCNWGYQHRKTIKDVYQLPAQMRKSLEDHQGVLYLSCEKEPKQEDKDVAERMVYAVMEATQGRSNEFNGYPYQVAWQEDPEGKDLLVISFIYMEEEEMEDKGEMVNGRISEESTEKADKALQEAFGDINGDIDLQDANNYIGY